MGEAEAALPTLAWHKGNEASRRLAAIPGVGGDAAQFRSARHFAAWIGLVPKQHSSGGKQRQGGISKQGNRYLRRLLVIGATAVIRPAGGRLAATPSGAWARALLERRPARLASVARANKTARIAWALLAKGETYRGAPVMAASAV